MNLFLAINTIALSLISGRDTVLVRQGPDALVRVAVDTVCTENIDSLRRRSPSLRSNIFYAGSATPNLGFEIPIGEHFTLGGNLGFKPWPRYLAWDNDTRKENKWRHLLLAPELRWWPEGNYRGLFVGADLLYTHYNVGGVRFPFDMYPATKTHRLQGDFYGLGLFAGRSWWLTRHLRLEAEAGIAVGYKDADEYECAWCGDLLGHTSGPVLVPKLGLNLAYNFFRQKKGEGMEIIRTPLDTLVRPAAVAPPEAFTAELPPVPDWQGVAGELSYDHPVLRPSSEYEPYTPGRILRKEASPLYVFFELDSSRLLREFRESGKVRDNGPVLDEIIDITSRILADTTSRVSCIQIIGLASVEGSISHNVQLADRRALALQHYIQQRLDVPDSLFETVGGGEAWTELRDEIHDMILAGGGAGLGRAQLESVLDIIDSESDAARREQALNRTGATWQTLRDKVLSDQRNSGYLRIYYDYVPDEGARRINDAIELLEGKDYKAAIQVLEALRDDCRSDNAYAVALFYNGREDEALDILRKAVERGDGGAAATLDRLEKFLEQRRAYERYCTEMEEYARLRFGR